VVAFLKTHILAMVKQAPAAQGQVATTTRHSPRQVEPRIDSGGGDPNLIQLDIQIVRSVKRSA